MPPQPPLPGTRNKYHVKDTLPIYFRERHRFTGPQKWHLLRNFRVVAVGWHAFISAILTEWRHAIKPIYLFTFSDLLNVLLLKQNSMIRGRSEKNIAKINYHRSGCIAKKDVLRQVFIILCSKSIYVQARSMAYICAMHAHSKSGNARSGSPAFPVYVARPLLVLIQFQSVHLPTYISHFSAESLSWAPLPWTCN